MGARPSEMLSRSQRLRMRCSVSGILPVSATKASFGTDALSAGPALACRWRRQKIERLRYAVWGRLHRTAVRVRWCSCLTTTPTEA